MILYQELTESIIGAMIEVHRTLGGPGLLESCYEECLCHELNLRGLKFRRQVELPIVYKGMRLDCGYRIDLVVEEKVILELKAIDELAPIHEAQLMTYIRLSGFRVGLLVNFNVPVLVDGLVRRII